MDDAWKEREKAKENEFFERENKKALERLQDRSRTEKRLSPITGEPMEQLTIHGVVVDRCAKSGGIWLDAGELELLMKSSKQSEKADSVGHWFVNFFEQLFSVKK